MSDISINITWWELIMVSPVLGWPGAIVGGLLGALLWRKRPILGGAIGALVGNLGLFTARILMM
jgi:putative Mn2+ efflux pump MntP